ncbi:MAG: O-antigen ligase family protein [Bacteroidetes bacterium]|nr:O-antigen ligase family protein [Bacteroidota bacterium]MBS1629252.1 O-antigen ligase family protein [Bacteroidota bacterium]
MSKSKLPQLPAGLRLNLALITLLAMIGGMLVSRSVASISIMLFGLVALWGIHPKEWLRQRWWLLGLGWIALYALSWFWTTDKAEWSAHLQVKLPFLLLPLAFGFLPRFSAQHGRVYTWALAAMMLAGAGYTMSFFLHGNVHGLIDQYKYAHVLATPMENDHISFSAAVALSIAWIVYYLPRIPNAWERIVLGFAALLLALYLHVLAAKTGLVACYILMLGLAFFWLKKDWRKGLLVLVLIAGLFVLAYATIPTLRERIGYSWVTWRAIQSGERTGVYSDAGRLFSYDIALRLIAKNPLFGVGSGDVLHAMGKGYAQWYPEVAKAQQLWPHNQWLTCALAAGIPTALLFTLWLFWPLLRTKPGRDAAFFRIVWCMLLVPLMVDAILEVQFGVGVFLIFLLVQYNQLDATTDRITSNSSFP